MIAIEPRKKPVIHFPVSIDTLSIVEERADVPPPSKELIERLNKLASEPPFCYRFKGREYSLK